MRAFWQRRSGRAPRVIGHRGVRREGAPPENTLGAFEAARAEGATAIELDVRTTTDDELVVLHDPTLERVTFGRDARAAAELSAHAVAAVDLGQGHRIPRLAEVLAFARETGLGVNVEMKRDVPRRASVVTATARLLARWDEKHPILVSSFDPVMLAALRALAPHIPRALLLHRTWWHEVAAWAASRAGADGVHLERTIASPELVRAMRARGLFVNVWTVNHEGEAKDLAGLPVDGIITDDPSSIRRALLPSA